MTNGGPSAFERLARDFLAQHPSIRHQWRPIRDRLWGDRLDLVLEPGSAAMPEVWASLREGQIAVGAGGSHDDFETFGRRISDEEVAQEAFVRFVALLRAHGYVAA
jgi:hypothetical protein